MVIQESAENYLETILILQKRNGTVRSIDIANELQFSKPSVSVAMKNLRNNGYIEMDKSGQIRLLSAGEKIAETVYEGQIRLLSAGEKIAETVYEKHTTITQFLTALGVDPQTAAEDACRIEHVISRESFEAIKRHAERKED